MNHTDYYVYAHRDLNGVVFYIGKGRRDRCKVKTNRCKEWYEIAEKGFTIEILKSGLDNKTALDYEKSLINSPEVSWRLVNKSKNSHTKDLDIDILNTYFYYDETSPTCLRWKIRNRKMKADSVAGTLQGDRYKVCVEYKKFTVHRIIYALFNNGIRSDLVVNHIDNNPLNNKITNLETCTIAENQRRTRIQNGALNPLNTSGVTGVRRKVHQQTLKEYYEVTWIDCGKQRSKYFNIYKHGETEAFRLACEYRKQMIEKLNSEGAGYSIAG